MPSATAEQPGGAIVSGETLADGASVSTEMETSTDHPRMDPVRVNNPPVCVALSLAEILRLAPDPTQIDPAVCHTIECEHSNLYGDAARSHVSIEHQHNPVQGLKVGAGPHYLAFTKCDGTVTLLDGSTVSSALRDSGSVPGYDGPLGNPRWERVADAIQDLPDLTTRLRAEADVRIGTPEVAMAPRPDHTYVQFPAWMWVDGVTEKVGVQAFDSIGATVRVRLWATPLHATFTPGDGKPAVRCAMDELIDPGPNPPDAFAAECTHTYRHSGSYTSTATVEWQYDYDISLRISPTSWDVGAPVTMAGTGTFTTPDERVNVFEIHAVN